MINMTWLHLIVLQCDNKLSIDSIQYRVLQWFR